MWSRLDLTACGQMVTGLEHCCVCDCDCRLTMWSRLRLTACGQMVTGLEHCCVCDCDCRLTMWSRLEVMSCGQMVTGLNTVSCVAVWLGTLLSLWLCIQEGRNVELNDLSRCVCS